MSKIKFWNSFPKSDRFIFLSLLLIISGLVSTLLVVSFIDFELVIQWTNRIENENIPVVVDSFNSLLYDFNVEIDQYLIFNAYDASKFQIIPWSWKLYLISYGLGLSLIAASISTIEKRFNYYIGITLFAILIIGLRLDGLVLFANKSPYLIGVFIFPYLALTYYLHAFADHVGIFKRILSFISLTLTLGLIAHFKSNLSQPIVHLADYAAMGSSILALLYILSISHDNIWCIVKLTSGTNSYKPKSNFYNFIVLTLLYLIFPTLLFLKHQGHIVTNLSYLNPFYLLIASSVVSIWAVRKRKTIYQRLFKYDPVAKYLHFGLMIITFSLLTFNYLTYNSSYIIFFEKMIIFSHLSFGCIFFIYVGYNFAGPYMENLKVDKIIYDGNKIPYSAVGFTSLGMIFLIMWSSSHIQYRQWLSGTFNLLAETELFNGSEFMSAKFYQTSLTYHNHNFKASYNLGQRALKSGDHDSAEQFFRSAAKFSEAKSPMTYIKLANEYKTKNEGFNEIWVLDDAHKEFPNSGEVLTNLGMALNSNGFLDSSITCFKNAALNLNTDNSKANAIGILAKADFEDNRIADLLLENSNAKHYESIINLSALYNLQGAQNKIPFRSIDLTKEELTIEHIAYIHNYTLNSSIVSNDKLKKELLTLQKKLFNTSFAVDIHFLLGYYEFYNDNKPASLHYFNLVMSDSPINLKPYYGLVISQLLMSSDYYSLAKTFLNTSLETQRFNPINDAPVLGLTNAILTRDTSMFEYSKSLISPYDSIKQSIITELTPILYEQDAESLVNYSDRQKVMFAQSRPELILTSDPNKILETFKDQDLKALYIAAAINVATEIMEPELNEYYWNKIPQVDLNEYTVNELNYQYINMLSVSYKFNEILDRIPTMTFNKNREKDIYFLSAKALQALGDNEGAKTQYLTAANKDGLNPKTLTATSNFLRKINNKEDAYKLISDAVNVFPNNTDINKEFCLQALEQNDFNTAEETLQDLSQDLSEEEFNLFKKEYLSLESHLGHNKEDW